MTEEIAASALAALGNPTRLRLFKLLVRAGDDGLNVGEIQAALSIPASTLAHHLSALTAAGLVLQQRHGREIRSRAHYEAMDRLTAYLTAECCEGVTFEEDCSAA